MPKEKTGGGRLKKGTKPAPHKKTTSPADPPKGTPLTKPITTVEELRAELARLNPPTPKQPPNPPETFDPDNAPELESTATPECWKSAQETLVDQLAPQIPALTRTRAKRHIPYAKIGGWKRVYLYGLSKGATHTAAALAAGIDRKTAFNARAKDPAFEALASEALEAGTDAIEDSLFGQAVYGVMEPIYHMGIVCGHVVKYNVKAAELLLKARRPEKFRDQIEHSGTVRTHLTLSEFEKRYEEAKKNSEE